MIDYAYLCQAIADARAGRRPTPPPSATPTLPGSGVTSTAPIELGAEFGGTDAELGGESGFGGEFGTAADSDLDYASADAVGEDDEGLEAADIETMDAQGDDGMPASERGFGDPVPAVPPPDYDSTMVYGTGGEMPGQSWEPAGADVGEAEPEIETEVELDPDLDVDTPRG